MSQQRAPSKSSTETKDRILSAAETLFMDQGFSTTSLRAITAKAKVNLAAVNYHFGSKDGLVREVLDRRLGPLNQARLEQLDRLEAESQGKALPVEKVVEAMVAPALHLSRDPLAGGATFLRLLGRALAEPADYLRNYLPTHYRDVVLRFRNALLKSLPNLPEVEVVWRLHFTIGAMAHAMVRNDALQLIAATDTDTSDDAEMIVRRLVPYLSAGLKAPAPVSMTRPAAVKSSNGGTRRVA